MLEGHDLDFRLFQALFFPRFLCGHLFDGFLVGKLEVSGTEGFLVKVLELAECPGVDQADHRQRFPEHPDAGRLRSPGVNAEEFRYLFRQDARGFARTEPPTGLEGPMDAGHVRLPGRHSQDAEYVCRAVIGLDGIIFFSRV